MALRFQLCYIQHKSLSEVASVPLRHLFLADILCLWYLQHPGVSYAVLVLLPQLHAVKSHILLSSQGLLASKATFCLGPGPLRNHGERIYNSSPLECIVPLKLTLHML